METFCSGLMIPDRTITLGSSCRGTVCTTAEDFLCVECFDWPPAFAMAAASVIVIIIIIIVTTQTTWGRGGEINFQTQVFIFELYFHTFTLRIFIRGVSEITKMIQKWRCSIKKICCYIKINIKSILSITKKNYANVSHVNFTTVKY